jgi:hypothetical protein
MFSNPTTGRHCCSTPPPSGFQHQPISDTPSPSSCSSNASTPTKVKSSSATKIPDLNQVLDIVEKFTLADKECVRKCMDQIEMLMHASLPPSPTSSPTHLRLGGNNTSSNLRIHRTGVTTSSLIRTEQTMETSLEQQRHSNQILDDAVSSIQHKEDLPSTPDRNARPNMFSSPFSDESTPTKVLDVARKNC